MKKIRKRIILRYKQFKNHPLTKGKEFGALCRYIIFNIKNRYLKSLTYNWIGGLKFIARKGDAGIVGNIYYGLYEFEESLFLLHLLRAEDLFLDVGANLGHYSLLMSGIIKCKTIAIEPIPDTFDQLNKQIKINQLEGLIKTRNIGLSNIESELYFSTNRGSMNRVVGASSTNSIKVKSLTIDSILNDTIPLAIKLDVEGYEKFVIEGANEVLNNNSLKVLIIELNQSGEVYNVEDKIVYKMIKEYGFNPFSYNLNNRQLIPLESFNTHKFNTIFIRDTAFVSKRLSSSEKINIKGNFF